MIENEITQTNIFFVDDNVFFKRSIFFNIIIKIETTKTNIFFVDDIIFFNREKNETIKFFIDRIEFYNQRKNEIQRVKRARNRSIFENYRKRNVFINNSTISLYNYKSQIFEHMNTSINYSKFNIYITIKISHQFVVTTQKSKHHLFVVTIQQSKYYHDLLNLTITMSSSSKILKKYEKKSF